MLAEVATHSAKNCLGCQIAESPTFVFNRNCENIELLAAPIPRAM